ncbi:hypothetical protein [Rhodoferax sp.]|uniref:hypothetical protein n=1 Tax=Rhodoferax sp. TaxID=50421 RepID=UPI0027369CD5|nr:hypothetical protein [Rhodoferax sp.]MDP3190642.1 hypothetical protein [Rhodoferax sp.]
MELAKQIIRQNLDSAYLQEQADTLTSVCERLRSIDQRSHLTSPQRRVLHLVSEILADMAHEHRFAISTVVAHEKEDMFAAEKAKSLLDVRSSGLSVGAKVALVGFKFPKLMKRGQLTMKSDPADLVGEKFQRGLTEMARDAVSKANRQDLEINVAVDKVWQEFEGMRPSLEQELFVRIRAYVKQLDCVARKT